MYITTDTLLDCFCLLINKNNATTTKLVVDVIDIYDKQQQVGQAFDKPIADFYIRILKFIIQQKVDKSDKESLIGILLKFKSDPVCVDYPDLSHKLEEMVNTPVCSGTKILQLRRSLNVIISSNILANSCKQMIAKIVSLQYFTTVEQQVAELTTIKQQLTTKTKEALTPFSPVNETFNNVNFSDLGSLTEQFKIYDDRTKIDSIIKLGLQGLNTCFGPNGGIIPGQSVVFIGASHQYKSSLLMSIAVWSLIYNELKPKREGATPVVLHISLENEPYQNVKWIFDKLYKQQNNQTPPTYTYEEMAKWVFEYFKKYNVTFLMKRYPAGTFTTEDYRSLVDGLFDEGYDVLLCVLDYLEEMSKKIFHDGNDSAMGRDLLIRNVTTALCDINKERGIAFVTGHATNRAVKDLPDLTNIVKKMNERHIAEGPAVKKIPDVLFYMGLEANPETNVKYLTIKLDKLRYFGDNLPESKRYFAYPFIPDYGIIDDLYSEKPGYVRDIYGDTRFDFSTIEGVQKAKAELLGLTPQQPTEQSNDLF